ncbi:hypothetical protein NP233_g11050 [Leucocoprinus birnbaumii]|uniref:MARVEL domain-containing protein n=1 Tax=Leucocoprinus birnbaumii TaxID=56174 RepID=A0AAD5YPA8_9AGAR|nr:hypothetical protein NP233_g11050 [Leucocoprinus birnbaumii]
MPRFVQNTSVPIIHAPKPKHARPDAAKRPPVFSWRSGLSHEYHIEHYQPPTSPQGRTSNSSRHAPSRSVELPRAAAPPVISAPVLPPIAEPETSENQFASSLYPMYMQQAVYNANTPETSTTRPEPALTRPSVGASNHAARHPALPPSPPPLGNWPRRDIISQPTTKGKRKPPPLVARGDFDSDSEAGSSRVPVGARHRHGERESAVPSSFQSMRPAGPRRRSESSDMTSRHPPLDRQKIETMCRKIECLYSIPCGGLEVTTVMFNSFLVLRTTFFALILMFGLLSLGFTAWNISSTIADGGHAPGSSIFMLFTSCLTILLVFVATIEYFKPHVRTAIVLVECIWIAVIALFQLGGAISTTTNSASLICQFANDWSTCASTSVLIPVSWINAFIAFAYFFVLFICVMSHVRTYPDVWARTIYTVDWFVDPRMKAFLHDATSQPRMVSWSEYLQGVRSTAQRRYLDASEAERDVEKAPWAENISVRRGKDDPYAASTWAYSQSGRSTPFSFGSSGHRTGESVSDFSELFPSRRMTTATENASIPPRPPAPPPKTLSKGSASSFGSKFIERLSRDIRKSPQHTLPQLRSMSPFPSSIEDHDAPIPLPHKSEWVRAERLT